MAAPILPVGTGIGPVRSNPINVGGLGSAEAAFRKDAASGGILGELLGMYPTQTEAINARKSAQAGILEAIKNLTSGTGSINPNLAGAAMDGTGVSGMPDPYTSDVTSSLDIFNPDLSAGGIGSERMPLTGGGDQPGDATFGGTIPEPRDLNLGVDIGAAGLGVEPPSTATTGSAASGEEAGGLGEANANQDLVFSGSPKNDMTALEEAQQKEDSGQSRALGQLSGYQELLKSSMKSYNDMMGLAPNKEQSIEDYKKQFSEATGIDISGEPDNRAALMSFGFALMQNKAGKGFNVGKMLSSVGEAGEAALPAMEKARSDAKAAQIAAGKYALSSRKGDKDARSKFIINQTQRLQDKTSAIYASELKRIEAMSDTKDKYKQERLLKQMKLKNDAEIQFMKLEAKYATGQYKLENKTTQQPIESLKGLKYTVGKNQNGQTVFMFPKDDARKFGQALSDVKEGKFALTGIESRLKKAIEDGRGSGGVSLGLLQEWGQGVASSFGVDFNQEPIFEKREVDIKDANGNITGTEIREVFTGEYKTDDRPLTEAKAIRDRVIAQFKRFLTQETGNGISNVDIQNIQNLLGNVDFMKNPQDALFRIREAKKIFEQREDAITGQLNLFDDQKRYSTPEQYADTRREISKSIVGAFKNKEEIEDAFGGSVTKDKDGMLTYNFTKKIGRAMGKIKINLPDESFFVEIEGETPSIEEEINIMRLVESKRGESARSQQIVEQQSRAESKDFIDPKTGVKSGSLRAVLSMAETAEEEDAKLTELFGMSKDTDFLRDNRGRLALTPEGGRKVGVDLAQNTLIDEEGLSRYDLADLTSMGADIAGGIYGTVKGAALGSAMGPVGTFLGGALGAGTGTAASGAIEEAIEGMLGVSRQSAGEITKDLALDFGIGAAGEVVIGGAIKIAAPFVRGLRGKRLEGEELKTIGMGLADEKASKRILLAQAKEISEQTGRPVDEVMTEISGPTGMGFGETRVGFGGLAPTLDSAGGTAIGSRAQRIGEKIRGTSERLIRNYKTLNDTFNTYKSQLGLSSDAPISQTIADEAGEVLKAGIQGKNQTLRVAEEEARMGVLNQFDELTKELGAAAKSDDSINDFVFQSLAKSLNQFDQLATSKYAAIDKVMKDTVGDAEIFLTSDLKETAKKLKTRYTPSIRASTGIPDKLADEDLVANAIIQGFEGLGDKASFAQLYLLRKKLWDTNFAFKGMNGTDKLDDAIRQIDGMMTEQAVKNVAISPAASSLSADSVQLLNNAAEQLAPARKFYLDGMTKIDNMTRATGLKELRDNVVRSRNSGTPIEDLMPNVTLMSKIIKNGDAQSVTKTLDVIRANAPKGQKDKLTNEFRERLATEWLTNAAKKTSFKADDAYAFKGSNFSQQIDDLGVTGDVLFGKERYAKIKNLADQIRQTTIPGRTSKVDVENALMMARSTGAKQPFVNALQNVAKAQKEAYDFQNNSIRKKILANEDIDAGVAASYISGPAKTNEVKSIMNSLDDAGREKVQQFFLSQLTQDFGVSALVDGKALQGMSKAFSAAAEKGKLRAVFGKETGIDMEKFAKILAANAKTAQGGDLIAANIAASPLQNLGSIIRATLVTRILDSAPIYRRVVRDYERMSKGLSPKSKSELLGQLIGATVSQTPGQALQEGVNEASKQIRAVADNSGLTEQLSAIQSQMTAPNAASSLGGVNVTQPAAPAGTSTIRQQAAANPGVAQALGIRGPTAGLLGTGNP